MSRKLRVGLKYCGGCRAQYDREGFVGRIRCALGDRIVFLPPDDPRLDFILAVMGCDSACADLSPYRNRRVRLIIITSEQQGEAFLDELKGDSR